MTAIPFPPKWKETNPFGLLSAKHDWYSINYSEVSQLVAEEVGNEWFEDLYRLIYHAYVRVDFSSLVVVWPGVCVHMSESIVYTS
jgi:hypothetical protein